MPEKGTFEELIAALQILAKYSTGKYPTHCEHDTMFICGGVSPDAVSDEDKKSLDNMGFFISKEEDCFMSFRYGSA